MSEVCVCVLLLRARAGEGRAEQGQEYACVREYMCCQEKERKSLRGVGEQKGVFFVGLELRSIKGYLDFA